MGIYGSYAKKLMEAKQQEAVAENISNEELQNVIHLLLIFFQKLTRKRSLKKVPISR